MKEWLRISFILCMFGFMRELRPSEPYITEFLLENRNITEDQINRIVYPVGTYSYLGQLIIIFLITDLLLYKPLIILMGCCGIIIWSCLLWTKTLNALIFLELLYGTYMATEVAYYTYIYAKVDEIYYSRVTAHTRAAMFLGKMVSGILAQLLLYLAIMDYRDLNYITLGAQIAATLWAINLPKVIHSLYFHRKLQLTDQTTANTPNPINSERNDQLTITISPIKLLWKDFKNAYTKPKVIQWCIWYALGLCGYLQVVSYVQIMWKYIQQRNSLNSIVWNGLVDACLTALSAISSLIAGYVHKSHFKSHSGLVFLALLSSIQGSAIFLCCLTTNIYLSYLSYVIFGVLYAFTITIVSSEVVRHLEKESFGLIFGINTMLALSFETILTIIIVSETGFALNIQAQYIVYASYFLIIGLLYLFVLLVQKCF